MTISTGFTAQEQKRLKQLITTATRFGVEALLKQWGLAALLPRSKSAPAIPLPERVVAALEQLGPVYVKLGQILATRGDILQEEWMQALQKLHQQAEPLPFADILPLLEAALPAPVADIFQQVDEAPLAAASIAQVHRAVLVTGEDVVVKIQRPAIKPLIETDLNLLRKLARFGARHSETLAHFQPDAILAQLQEAMVAELNFLHEAQNTEAVAENFTHKPHIVFPTIFREYSSPTVLVQSFLAGHAPHNAAQLEALGLNPILLAERGTDAILQMVFRDGLFHGDPHPGNLLCMEGNRIGFIDFGMTGRISPRRKGELLQFLNSIISEQPDNLVQVMLQWNHGAEVDMPALRHDASMYVAKYHHPPLHFGKASMDFMALARRHRILLPTDTTILFKCLMTAERIALTLNPQTDALAQAKPYAQAWLREQFSPETLFHTFTGTAKELHFLHRQLPSVLREALRHLQAGKVKVELEMPHLEKSATHLEYAATRISLALVAAAFIIGLAPSLLHAEKAALGFPLFTLLGSVATLFAVGWLFLHIRK